MARDALKRAMLRYAPELVRDYKAFVRGTLKRMKADLGPGLAGVHNSWKWARTYQGIRANIVKKDPQGRHVFRGSEYDKVPAVVDTARLNQNAKAYGEATTLGWYNKMLGKLGMLSGVKVVLRGGGDIRVTGRHRGDAVTIDQQRIINVSSRGTLFHQFPSRIYLNGKFMSEAAYKRYLQGGKG